MTLSQLVTLAAKDKIVRAYGNAVLSFSIDTWELLIEEWINRLDPMDYLKVTRQYGPPEESSDE